MSKFKYVLSIVVLSMVLSVTGAVLQTEISMQTVL